MKVSMSRVGREEEGGMGWTRGNGRLALLDEEDSGDDDGGIMDCAHQRQWQESWTVDLASNRRLGVDQ